MSDIDPACEYADGLAEIKHAAALEFGREAEIFVDGKRVDTVGDCCWQLRQIDYSLSVDGVESDLPFYRLDVQRGDVNSHAIFNPRKDLTEDVIKQKFKALNVSYEEYIMLHKVEGVCP